MTAIQVVPETPLATSLQNAVQPKLAEMGWSSGGLDDSALAEYIVLMLVNGKTQEQIASELGSDLLGVGPDDAGVLEFTKWLFDRVEVLGRNGDAYSGAQSAAIDGNAQVADEEIQDGLQDAEMDDVPNSESGAIPTGPKSMRDGAVKPAGNWRILGQMNRAMDRTPDVLHKIKGTASTGRINSHTREPPKGPAPKGPAPKGPRSQITRNIGGPAQRIMPTGQMPQMGQMSQNNTFGAMTPQQQMQLFAMYEEQARLMAQILSPQQQMAIASTQTQFPAQAQPSGKSLFERVQGKPNGNYNTQPYQNGHQSRRPQGIHPEASNFSMNSTSSMAVELNSQTSAKPDPCNTVCYYNLTCTKPDCAFVHQSPAAPAGTTIDMTDTCSFGAACKSRKCVGKHPSPASKQAFKAQAECRFFPNCTNAACPFFHPSVLPCRNGADCTVPNCKFSHSKIACRYDPCMNPACPYKHADGQKRGSYKDKVWVNEDGSQKEHVSERKFVDNDEEEDLILPGQGDSIEESRMAERVIA